MIEKISFFEGSDMKKNLDLVECRCKCFILCSDEIVLLEPTPLQSEVFTDNQNG